MELGRMEASLIQDRDVLKWRVNMIRNGRVVGWMKPAV